MAVETALLYPLGEVAARPALGVVYVLGVLVADAARRRAEEAERAGREAGLVAELARVLAFPTCWRTPPATRATSRSPFARA